MNKDENFVEKTGRLVDESRRSDESVLFYFFFFSFVPCGLVGFWGGLGKAVMLCCVGCPLIFQNLIKHLTFCYV